MNPQKPTVVPTDAEFHLRVRQAILVAQSSARQIGLLVIQCPGTTNGTAHLDDSSRDFESSLFMQVRNALRDSDTIMQLSEHVLGVLLPYVRSTEDVELVIWRILGKIDEAFCEEIKIGKVAPAIGAAIFPDHASNASQLLQCAEKALNQAQLNSRRFAIRSVQVPSHNPTKQLMTELRQAIVADQLFLAYQPKVNLSGAYVTGVEALARWQHPERGVVGPDEFIPVAERTGLIIPLTLWVLQSALLQCRQWLDRGLDLSVAVNLTMWNLETQELPEQVAAILRDTGVPPENLELEITESSIMGDPQKVITTLNIIRSLGVRCTIDDFGTGYSSFSYLSKLPVKSIKIDKSFVLSLDTDRDNALIVRSIIDLSHNLGLKVVAEGVESAAARDMLKSFGCDEAQGYFYSRPQPAEIITNFLSEPPLSLIPNQCNPNSGGNEFNGLLEATGQIVPDMVES
jgi:EAL domain-containing protein (putative c-di-GMP-specific phosphodiesterase class I)/GGDEF domain-containing protein